MKPNPFASLNHFTLPVAIDRSCGELPPRSGGARVRPRRGPAMGVRRRERLLARVGLPRRGAKGEERHALRPRDELTLLRWADAHHRALRDLELVGPRVQRRRAAEGDVNLLLSNLLMAVI